MQNVELKTELIDLDLARLIVRRLGANRIGMLHQVDTYFRVPDFRLKKRVSEMDGHAEPIEYIRYERADRSNPKISRFAIYSETEAAKLFGTNPMPIRAVVEKTRELWMIDTLRIHLDEVRDLGRFLEIEALVTPRQNVARCHARIAHIRRHLAPALGEPISCSYADLIEREPTKKSDRAPDTGSGF
ncbi:MAG: CYTH domain-containing protein [Planctomycetota bacterium]|nr:MAG: CYTH domain-containing protein [Planctomycetota bacterium]